MRRSQVKPPIPAISNQSPPMGAKKPLSPCPPPGFRSRANLSCEVSSPESLNTLAKFRQTTPMGAYGRHQVSRVPQIPQPRPSLLRSFTAGKPKYLRRISPDYANERLWRHQV